MDTVQYSATGKAKPNIRLWKKVSNLSFNSTTKCYTATVRLKLVLDVLDVQ